MSTLREAPPAPDLRDPALYVNRELSWLDFNRRVLALARDEAMPLLERCKFMAITSSNLDEFFMVRVASVLDALEAGRKPSTPDQMPRERVLEQVKERTDELMAEQSRIWREELLPALAEADIAVAAVDDLPEATLADLQRRFEREILPVLTPLAVGPGLPFPYISGLSLNLGLSVRDPLSGETRFARVKVPPMTPRFLRAGSLLVPVEQIIARSVDRVFPGMEITQATLFRVTRDADFSISDEAEDLLGAVEAQVRRRRFGEPVRLEVAADAPDALVEELRSAHGLEWRDVYRVEGLLDFTGLWQLYGMDRAELKEAEWTPVTHPRLRGEEADIFAAIRAGDVLVHHPYDDFDTSVARFVEQATEDPDVLAIKQTLYRTSGDTPIVPALIRAAEKGKGTVCLVELKARFDEERNIRWAKALERAGVHVVYGLPGLKTHAKLCMVVRREGDHVRRYVHIGTGNYHASTARLYTDLGLLTCDPVIGEDLTELFNYLTTGYVPKRNYRKLLPAPKVLKPALLAKIEREIGHARAGKPALIQFKMNALEDKEVTAALYRAAQAGVKVDLIVRDTCRLRPGIPGISENARVVSIVGRFLEHTRIFYFLNGGAEEYFIGSADCMKRNLESRVEVVAPVEAPELRRDLRQMLDVQLNDRRRAWDMRPDGSYVQRVPGEGDDPRGSQQMLIDLAERRQREAQRLKKRKPKGIARRVVG